MHIFCRETQAHLDLNPHLVNASSSSNLITPELWLKNCKSRSISPASERSTSPNTDKKQNEKDPLPNQRKSPLPLITIAPPAKLMNKSVEERCIQKSPEGKKDTRTKMNLRKRRTSKCSATVTSQTVRQHNSTPKAQDMRMCSPSIDGSSPSSSITANNSTIHSPPNTMNQQIPPPFPNPMFGMPPPVFVDNNNGHINDHRHPMFMPRLGFMPPPPGMMHQERPRLLPSMNFPQHIGQAPPVTVLVPYPVILPIPLPIPVPIPLTSFLQAHQLNKVKTEVNNDDTEGPLDFTINSDKNKNVNISNREQDAESNTETQDKTDQIDPNKDINERIDSHKCSETAEVSNPEQTLPKFKITRLGNKMAKIVAKTREPSESSRPLRKRRRLVEATDEESLIPKTRKIVQV